MDQVYREKDDGTIVKGIGLPAFIHNGRYYCVLVKVYEDGVIDCWDEVDFEGFVQKVRGGWVVTQLPPDAVIHSHHSFYGSTDNLTTWVKESEFIKEVRDTLDRLCGKSWSSRRCNDAFVKYLSHPTEETKKLVAKEYDLVPEHLRQYVLGDMDHRDAPIRELLENDSIDASTLQMWKTMYHPEVKHRITMERIERLKEKFGAGSDSEGDQQSDSDPS